MPRISKRQAKIEGLEDLLGLTENLPNIEKFYRRTIFEPFLNDFLESLSARFETHSSNVCPLLKLLPRNLQECNNETLKQVYEFYEPDLNIPFDILEGEIRLWKQKWKDVALSTKPKSALSSLKSCSPDIFPSTFRLIKVLSTMPISVASAERTFSCLRRLKTYLRSTMKEERLNSLALLNVHYKTEIRTDDVLTEFKRKNRKILLP